MEAPLQTPKQGPVAAYSFDKGEGTTVEDLTGDGNTATLEGATWTTHGRYGGALEFDGPEEPCASVPNSASLQLGEDFTLEAWVKTEGAAYKDPILQKEDGGYELGLGLQGGDTAEAYIGEEGGGYERAVSPTAIEPGVWTHVAATYDGAHIRLYVDGELVATKHTTTPNFTTTGPLEIGCSHEGAGQYFGGRIDEVRVYERALGAGEVGADMESPIQTPKQGPVAAYSFDEGEEAGTTVEDLTGDGNTATLEGATRTTHGRYGDALEFDGAEEQCASVANSEA